MAAEFGRTLHTLRDAGQGQRKGYRDGDQCLDQAGAQAAEGALPFPDMGVARRWPTTSVLQWRPISRCTSMIHKAHGNAVRTRTPMACSDNTSRREQTYCGTRRRNSMRWQDSSTNDHAKRYTTKHRPNDSKLVLRRPVECAAKNGAGRLGELCLRLDVKQTSDD